MAEEKHEQASTDDGAVVSDVDAVVSQGQEETVGESQVQTEGGEPSAELEPEVDVTQLVAELDAARDTALRAQAEAQNVKRRAEQDVEKARKFALEKFCAELLPVVDNLERALESAGGDEEILKPIAEGVDLTLKSFMDALRKFNIEAVDPSGEPFDPQQHQAMSMIENPDAEPNTVISVMQKGYTLNGRLVRPAMVLVSKAPAGS